MKHAFLYFDDYCYLCSNTIRILRVLDSKKKFKFYGLNAEVKPDFLEKAAREILASDSIVLYQDEKFYVKSKAVFQCFKILGGGFQIFLVFKIIPIRIWDKIYDIVARYRYKLFGKRKSCYLPKNQH